MNVYSLLYLTHVTTVALSFSFFVLRGIWMMQGNELLDRRSVRILPHVIDTILLGSAIGLAISTRQYPIVMDWLTAKIIALVIYIWLGMIALRRGRTRRTRFFAFFLAVFTFGYIVSVAWYHHPLGFLTPHFR